MWQTSVITHNTSVDIEHFSKLKIKLFKYRTEFIWNFTALYKTHSEDSDLVHLFM